MKCKVIGIDLAKRAMQVCRVSDDQQIISNKKVSRSKLLELICQAPADVPVVMESCATAHHWGRQFQALGRDVFLIPAQHVKPLVGHQKNDANDAVAICEAAFRPRIHRVPIKSVEQQDLQSLRRIRQRHVDNRTALGNQIRGLCTEYGLCFRQSLQHLRTDLREALADENNQLSTLLRGELDALYGELLDCDARVKRMDRQIQSVLKHNKHYALLREIPGVGPMIGSALISSLGDATQFNRGRDLSAWVGLVPRQHSSGSQQRLLGITKNGDKELRTLLVHGARAAVYRYRHRDDNALSRWLKPLIARRGIHKAIVALANKLGRIAWAVMRYEQSFDMRKAFA